MKYVLGIIIFFITGAILGGGILGLSLWGSIILGGVFYTAYQGFIVKDLTFPMALWIFLIGWRLFIWVMS